MRHPSMFQLDALIEGAVEPREHAELQAHVETCAACRATLDESRGARDRFARSVLPRTLDQVASRRRWSLGTLGWLLAPAMVLALVFWVAAPHLHPAMSDRLEAATPPATLDGQRAELVAYAASEHAPARPLGRHGTIRIGELVRLAADETGLPWVTVLSIGPDGHVRVRAPIDGGQSERLTPGHTELAGSFLMSHEELPARLVAVFSTEPLDASDTAQRLERGTPIEHTVQRTVWLEEVR